MTRRYRELSVAEAARRCPDVAALLDDPCADPVVRPTADERRVGALGDEAVDRAAFLLERCGVVALDGAPRAFADGAGQLRSRVLAAAAPALSERQALRETLKNAMRQRTPLRDVLRKAQNDEGYLARGGVYRERNDARIDVLLDASADELLLPFVAAPVLRRVLGDDAELKSRHALIALPGTETQHWHRDTEPLFPDAPPRPYAVNAFVYTEDLSNAARGATEFVPGSTRWPEIRDDGVERTFLFEAGTVVLADYRCVHRGGALRAGTEPRVVAMYVYGKAWWRDSVNYGGDDYGGFRAPSAEEDASPTLRAAAPGAARRREAMFWGLANQWEASLRGELDRDHAEGGES